MIINIDTKPKEIKPYDLHLCNGSESFGTIKMSGTQGQSMDIEIDERDIVGYTRRLASKTKKGVCRYWYDALVPIEVITEEHREYVSDWNNTERDGVTYYKYRVDRQKNKKWKTPKFETNLVWVK